MRTDDIIAVLCSDIHLSHKAPRFRANEPNWYAAMLRTIDQVRAVVEKYNVPLVVAGDIFDGGWKPSTCPPELLNFAIKYLPRMYAVPGQHDLPNHRYEDIERTGYQTLVESGIVIDIKPGIPIEVGELILHGFPWGYPIRPRHGLRTFGVDLAVVHSYLWTKGCSYEGASDADHYIKKIPDWEGYTAVVYGDNHKGFKVDGMGLGDVLNCGTLMIRKSDERDYKPHIGILHRDGEIDLHYLDTTQDRYTDDIPTTTTKHNPLDVSAFIGGLNSLSKGLYDFEDTVLGWLSKNEVEPRVKDIILNSLTRKK